MKWPVRVAAVELSRPPPLRQAGNWGPIRHLMRVKGKLWARNWAPSSANLTSRGQLHWACTRWLAGAALSDRVATWSVWEPEVDRWCLVALHVNGLLLAYCLLIALYWLTLANNSAIIWMLQIFFIALLLVLLSGSNLTLPNVYFPHIQYFSYAMQCY